MKQRMGMCFLAGVFLILFGGRVHCLAGVSDAKSWGYQLQNADSAELAASGYDVLVIDYSRDGTDEGAYTASEIKSVKDSGKTVLAYLSIGEAENYRFYWRPSWKPGNPAWLGPENPEWEGNYKVRYWNEGWWTKALKPYLDRIVSAGFDGVYMDIIDAYWYWHVKGGYSCGFTASKMIQLVERIGNYTRSLNPQFVLCPQNAESIIDDAPTNGLRSRYLTAIDAIGVEDLFYHFGSIEDRKYRMGLLRSFENAGKKVFNVEYISTASWPAYRQRVCAAGFEIIPYAAAPDRELDELIDFPEGDCP